MFTWIPIYEETAKRLLDFKDCSHELVVIPARMKDWGLITTKLADQGLDGSMFQLKDIDPFTFFANFNRGTRVFRFESSRAHHIDWQWEPDPERLSITCPECDFRPFFGHFLDRAFGERRSFRAYGHYF